MLRVTDSRATTIKKADRGDPADQSPPLAIVPPTPPTSRKLTGYTQPRPALDVRDLRTSARRAFTSPAWLPEPGRGFRKSWQMVPQQQVFCGIIGSRGRRISPTLSRPVRGR